MIAPALPSSSTAFTALEFIAAIFQPGDIVEFRCIHSDGSVRKFWSYADEVGPIMGEITALNDESRRYNVFFGPNPRCELNKSGDENALLARTIFADFDKTAEAEARRRIEAAHLPQPTALNWSGHGVHTYWLLAGPIEDLAIWTEFQASLAALLGSDGVVKNPERVMRLPGTRNWKEPAADCVLIECDRGTVYEWAEILPLIPKPANGKDHPAIAEPVGDSIADGKRNVTLTSLAGTMRRRGMTRDAIEAALLAENRAKCRPMLPDDEVRSIAESIGKYEPAAEEKHPAPAFQSVRDLCHDHPQLRPPIIHGLLRVGETGNVVGAPKSMKSWLVKQAAISIAAGRMFLGKFQVEQGDVLILDNELHPETLANRIPKICAEMGVTMTQVADHLFVESLRGRLRDIHALADYFLSLPRGRFKLIVLDALYRLLPIGTDENSNADVASIYNAIDRYAAHVGCAFLVVHHSSKGVQAGKSVVDVGAGASSQSRAADAHLILRPHDEDGAAVFEAAVRSWPPVTPFCLRWAYPVWKLAEDLDPSKLRESSRRKPIEPAEPIWTPETFAARFIGTEPQTEARIVLAAAEADIKERAAKRFLRAAVDDTLAHRWKWANPSTPHRFATIPQPAEGGAK